jgi:DNA-binding response OmpR family regulator
VAETRTRALVIEDDPAYARLLLLHLRSANYEVQHVERGQDGLAAFDDFQPDIIILDVVLPDMNGFEVCRSIREVSSVPIVMLTNRAEERHKVQGLMLGADDYVTKPFSVPELLARLTTILRRARRREPAPQPPISVGDVTIDLEARRVYRKGEVVPLTATEFKLLVVLGENAGRVLVNDELLRRVWGPGSDGDGTLLRTTIGRLRRKLGGSDGTADSIVQNVRGIGYTLAAP